MDGDYFTITQGTTNFVFEFEDIVTVPGGDGASRVGSILIGYDPAGHAGPVGQPHRRPPGKRAGTDLDGGQRGDRNHQFDSPRGNQRDAAAGSQPPVPDRAVVAASALRGGAEVADGDYFTVIDGTTRFLFEFEDMAGAAMGAASSVRS